MICNSYFHRLVTLAILLPSCHSSFLGPPFVKCHKSTIVKCLENLKKYKGEPGIINYYENKTAQVIICKEYTVAMVCVENYMKKCSDEDGVDAPRIVKASKMFKNRMDRYCASSFSTEEISSNRCLLKYGTQHDNECNIRAGLKIKEANMIGDQERRAFILCRLLEEYKSCTNTFFHNKCGNKTMQYVEENVIEPLSRQQEYKDCKAIRLKQLEVCKHVNYVKCFDNFHPSTNETLMLFSERNKTVINKICRGLNKSLTCTENFKTKCMIGQEMEGYAAAVEAVSINIKKFCNNEMSSEEIQINKCIGGKVPQLEQSCYIPFDEAIRNLSFNKIEGQQKAKLICRSLHRFKICIINITKEDCGEASVRMFENTITNFQAISEDLKGCESRELSGGQRKSQIPIFSASVLILITLVLSHIFA